MLIMVFHNFVHICFCIKKCLNLSKLQNRKEPSKKLTLCNVVVSDHDDIITISETECRNIRHLHINLPATTTKGKLRKSLAKAKNTRILGWP